MVDKLARFTTNGMFIIDDIETHDGKLYQNIVGGAGTYAILGSLIIATGLSKWIVDRGTDFPENLTKEITQWNLNTTVWRDLDRLTTRGLNYYANDSYLRTFKYLTPKKQIEVEDWVELYGLEQVKAFSVIHLVSSMERTSKLIDDLSKTRSMQDLTLVWEPTPESCKFENLFRVKQIINSCSSAMVFSPNLEESLRLLNYHKNEDEIKSLEDCIPVVNQFITILKTQDTCVIRCGSLGSITLTPIDRKIIKLPAYYQDELSKVIDPTGGGNSFLGGLSMGLILKPNDWKFANICGHIASSFCIEQNGIPSFQNGTCNGSGFSERLKKYERENLKI